MTKWLQQYILLVLRIGKAIRSKTQEVLYDFYRHILLEPALSGRYGNEKLRRILTEQIMLSDI
ncbi:MAG TPA: hypothetical protein VEG39_16285 [Clostridia bacterium]|nr:hypothetical protein [Clostridia bacterium]